MIEDIKKEYDEIINRLSDPELISDWERFEELSKKKKKLEKIIDKCKEINDIENRVEENKGIIKSEEDQDLVVLAQSEMAGLEEKKSLLNKELKELLEEDEDKEKNTVNSVIVEIRAGTGGDEAALFAGDLYRMYTRYAVNKGWTSKVLDSHPTDLNGFKEVIFEMKGNEVYSKMKNEGGVHRVQRIPETEKSGRIHTSTASVAILIKPKITELKIKPQDLRIDIAKASGPGGQNVNKRMTAVRITHLPTGIMVKSMAERTLPQNKENALSILSAKLAQIKEKQETSVVSNKRRSQIGAAKRVEKIRTYNLPQDRITDHRIKKSWHSIEEIMEGNLDKMMDDLKNGLKED
jgi:peptide chain release factor 1